MKKAILFKSKRRFEKFYEVLVENHYEVTVLDFNDPSWINYDYSDVDLLIYFPNFIFSSNNPHALSWVQDNLAYISRQNSHLQMFPDPNVIRYYSDKYQQYLFLENTDLPIIPTIPLMSIESISQAEDLLGYPMIIKNRYGAGGDFVFLVKGQKELRSLFKQSTMDLFNFGMFLRALKKIASRDWLWSAIRNKRVQYPFMSYPLLAQKFVQHDCDLKTVVGNNRVVEAHWRRNADADMWKMNIDGGGIGEWSYVPSKPIELSERLSVLLSTKWLNIDFMVSGDYYWISEFSPVWHHYKYMEKESFVYKDDYNIPMPLEKSLQLEEIIVESYSSHLKSCTEAATS